MGLSAKLPRGGRQRKSVDPVVSARELQRYKRLLLAKRDELSAPRGGAAALVPPADGLEGDLMDRASADAEAELQVRLHQSDAHLVRAIEEALARIKRGTFGVIETCNQPKCPRCEQTYRLGYSDGEWYRVSAWPGKAETAMWPTQSAPLDPDPRGVMNQMSVAWASPKLKLT